MTQDQQMSRHRLVQKLKKAGLIIVCIIFITFIGFVTIADFYLFKENKSLTKENNNLFKIGKTTDQAIAFFEHQIKLLRKRKAALVGDSTRLTNSNTNLVEKVNDLNFSVAELTKHIARLQKDSAQKQPAIKIKKSNLHKHTGAHKNICSCLLK